MPDGKRHCAIAPTTEELIATVVPPSSFARAIDNYCQATGTAPVGHMNIPVDPLTQRTALRVRTQKAGRGDIGYRTRLGLGFNAPLPKKYKTTFAKKYFTVLYVSVSGSLDTRYSA